VRTIWHAGVAHVGGTTGDLVAPRTTVPPSVTGGLVVVVVDVVVVVVVLVRVVVVVVVVFGFVVVVVVALVDFESVDAITAAGAAPANSANTAIKTLLIRALNTTAVPEVAKNRASGRSARRAARPVFLRPRPWRR
jgi:hypothetical protein